MAPVPTGTASCMYRPRCDTMRNASAKPKVPAATCAEYSPSECPAAHAGARPRVSRTRYAAMLVARMAGCVFSVSVSCWSGPSKHKAAQRAAQRRVGLGKRRTGFGEGVGEGLAHADRL